MAAQPPRRRAVGRCTHRLLVRGRRERARNGARGEGRAGLVELLAQLCLLARRHLKFCYLRTKPASRPPHPQGGGGVGDNNAEPPFPSDARPGSKTPLKTKTHSRQFPREDAAGRLGRDGDRLNERALKPPCHLPQLFILSLGRAPLVSDRPTTASEQLRRKLPKSQKAAQLAFQLIFCQLVSDLQRRARELGTGLPRATCGAVRGYARRAAQAWAPRFRVGQGGVAVDPALPLRPPLRQAAP
jgi:hypothetical protein